MAERNVALDLLHFGQHRPGCRNGSRAGYQPHAMFGAPCDCGFDAAYDSAAAALRAREPEGHEGPAWTVTRLRSALEAYGRHYDWCASRASAACDCGLADILRRPSEFLLSRAWCIAAAERESTSDASIGPPPAASATAEVVRQRVHEALNSGLLSPDEIEAVLVAARNKLFSTASGTAAQGGEREALAALDDALRRAGNRKVLGDNGDVILTNEHATALRASLASAEPARQYLARLLTRYAPGTEPGNALGVVCMQIDNLLRVLRERTERAGNALAESERKRAALLDMLREANQVAELYKTQRQFEEDRACAAERRARETTREYAARVVEMERALAAATARAEALAGALREIHGTDLLDPAEQCERARSIARAALRPAGEGRDAEGGTG